MRLTVKNNWVLVDMALLLFYVYMDHITTVSSRYLPPSLGLLALE